MSKCQLILTNIKQESKAPRFFWLFKPKELVYHEPFDLQFTLKNNTDQRFEGGRLDFEISGELTWDHTIELPIIEPHMTTIITKQNIVVQDLGFILLEHIVITHKDGNRILCLDKDSKDVSLFYIPLLFSTREELYQKYAVVVALFFSILASFLTIINVIIAIFD